MRNREMLKFVADHLKTEKMSKHAVRKLPYLLRYVLGQYKAQQMCDKAILENGGTLNSVCDYHRNHEMYNKAVGYYPHALEFVPECYKTQKRCDEAADTPPPTINMFLKTTRLKKSVIKQFIDVFLYLILFLIKRKLKKYET